MLLWMQPGTTHQLSFPALLGQIRERFFSQPELILSHHHHRMIRMLVPMPILSGSLRESFQFGDKYPSHFNSSGFDGLGVKWLLASQ
jgi:hypothetical protein